MKRINIRRLKREDMFDLISLTTLNIDAPFDLSDYDRRVIVEMVTGEDPTEPCSQVYGVFKGDELISISVATFGINGLSKTVRISGTYTIPSEREEGHERDLIALIERDAANYFKAVYLFCEENPREIFSKSGFIETSGSKFCKIIKYV